MTHSVMYLMKFIIATIEEYNENICKAYGPIDRSENNVNERQTGECESLHELYPNKDEILNRAEVVYTVTDQDGHLRTHFRHSRLTGVKCIAPALAQPHTSIIHTGTPTHPENM